MCRAVFAAVSIVCVFASLTGCATLSKRSRDRYVTPGVVAAADVIEPVARDGAEYLPNPSRYTVATDRFFYLIRNGDMAEIDRHRHLWFDARLAAESWLAAQGQTGAITESDAERLNATIQRFDDWLYGTPRFYTPVTTLY